MDAFSEAGYEIYFDEKKVDIDVLTDNDDDDEYFSPEAQDPLAFDLDTIKTEVTDNQEEETSSDNMAMSCVPNSLESSQRILIKEELIIKEEVPDSQEEGTASDNVDMSDPLETPHRIFIREKHNKKDEDRSNMSFHAVPGLRQGATLFTGDDGYYYRYISVNTSKNHYVCYKKNCNARIFVLAGTQVAIENTNFPFHNHGREPHMLTVFALRNSIIDRVGKESVPLKTIFEEETNKVPLEVAQQLSYSKLESTLRKSRRKCFPCIPDSPEQLAELLESEEWNQRYGTSINGKQFFRENLIVEGNSNLVFFSENLKKLLSTTIELLVDYSFEWVPSMPRLKYLLVIQAMAFDHAFPVTLVLMEKRTYACYQAIFSFIRSLVPDTNPRTVMTEYEVGLMKAVREAFPDAEITGCWWNFANHIMKRAKKLRLIEDMVKEANVKRIVTMCMSLPLLPGRQIQEGMEQIRLLVNKEEIAALTISKLIALLAYINSHWIGKVGVEQISVYDAPNRSNTDSESFNVRFRREVGHAHPIPWKFLDQIKNIENSEAGYLDRCKLGLPLSRNKRRRFLMKETVLKRAMQLLSVKRHTVKEFLEVAASLVGRQYVFPAEKHKKGDDRGAEEEEEEEDDCLGPPPSPVPPLGGHFIFPT